MAKQASLFDLSPAKVDPKVSVKGRTCATCGRYQHAQASKLEVRGQGRLGVMIIGDFPEISDDARPFSGVLGDILRDTLRAITVDLDVDCWSTYACRCAGDGSEPSVKQIEACRPDLYDTIMELKPHVIIPLGAVATRALLGAEYQEDNDFGESRWHGFVIPSPLYRAYLCPTFTLNSIYEKLQKSYRGTDISELVFKKQLNAAFTMLDYDLPEWLGVDWLKRVTLLDQEGACDCLTRMMRSTEPVSFDYETTGIKPHRPGHRIVCCSICNDDKESFAFMMTPRVNAFMKEFLDSKVKKVAANMAFEDSWSRTILGVQPRNWDFDTMLAAHVLDNRAGKICGLKFQVYANFGEGCYTSGVDNLKDKNLGPNDFNGIDTIPQDVLLQYCGLDSLFEHMLAVKQRIILKHGRVPIWEPK